MNTSQSTNSNQFLEISDKSITFSNGENLPIHETPIKTNALIVAICIKGKVDVKINMEDFELKPSSIAIILPGSFIKVEEPLLPLSLNLINISDEFLQVNIGLKQCIWKNGSDFYKNPIISIKEKDMKVYEMYLDLLKFISQDNSNLYKHEKIQSILIALLFEALSNINENCENEPTIDIHNNETAAARKFIEMLIRDEGKHRCVEYYAKALCYTPKHFCSLIKKAMGQTPLKIINDHATLRIKHDLIYTNLELNGIAEKYNFSNYSFFGKFVKKHLGLCPKIYRRKNKKLN